MLHDENKVTTNIIDKGSDVIATARKTSKTIDKTLTGAYEIIFKSNKNYVGKGGFDRAIRSAIEHAKPNKLNGHIADEVVSIMWKAADTPQQAFIEEFALQSIRGVANADTYNKIWSPGKKLYKIFYGS